MNKKSRELNTGFSRIIIKMERRVKLPGISNRYVKKKKFKVISFEIIRSDKNVYMSCFFDAAHSKKLSHTHKISCSIKK